MTSRSNFPSLDVGIPTGLPSETDVRRLPQFRAIFLAATWARRALSLYKSGNDPARSGVTREESRHLEDAVCAAIEVATDPERWSSDRFLRVDPCVRRIEPLYIGTSVTA